MLNRKYLMMSAIALVCGCLVTMAACSAWGEPPPGVVRIFAVEVNAFVDFRGEDSVGVMVAPPPQQLNSTIEFAHSTVDSSLDGTVWEFQPAMHITAGEEETSAAIAYWLVDSQTPTPPPTGAFTLNGKGAFTILEQQEFWVRQTVYPDDPGQYVVTNETYGEKLFIVVTAVFSR